jgi:hypothetical protein
VAVIEPHDIRRRPVVAPYLHNFAAVIGHPDRATVHHDLISDIRSHGVSIEHQ